RRTKVKTTFLSKGNDGVLLSKKLSEKDFHFLGMLFQEYHVRFLSVSTAIEVFRKLLRSLPVLRE
ncbi:MAG: hypothetical protein AAGU10_00955, partial [Methanosarcina mazei]